VTQLALYETARAALIEALRVDEVLAVKDQAERIRLYGRQARDRRIIADATELQMRAERKLGVLLKSAHETGQLGYGRRSNLDRNGSTAEPFEDADAAALGRVTLSEIGVDKKLSSKAQRWAALGDPEFEEKLRAVRDKIEGGGAVVVNPLRDLTTAEKKAKRATREAELGARQAALPEAKFGVIYADPEWQFEVRSEGGMDRAADNHYPTSGLDAIKGRDVGSLAAADCVLFLWATVPMLADAIDVLRGWGFAYKSNFNWHKDRCGTGYWSRNRHEHLLVGTRGNVPAPAMGTQFDSSIEAAVGAHSAKPETFYEIIEAYFPTLPKIELNARTARKGWARWGLEAPAAEPAGNLSGGEVSAHQGREGCAREAGEAPGDVSGGDVSAESQAKPRGKAPAADPSSGAARHLLPQGEKEGRFRFTPADDAVLRLAYALPLAEFDLGIVAAAIGCSKLQARRRASHLGIARAEHQRAAVAEANRRRGQG